MSLRDWFQENFGSLRRQTITGRNCDDGKTLDCITYSPAIEFRSNPTPRLTMRGGYQTFANDGRVDIGFCPFCGARLGPDDLSRVDLRGLEFDGT